MKAVSAILLILLSFLSKGQQVVQLCPGYRDTFTYYATSSTTGVWLWTVNDRNISSTNFVTITWDSVGTYTLVVNFYSGCEVENQYIIQVLECSDYTIYFPSAFSPNGDGLNDYWKPEGIGIDDIRWYIFDRWGLQIYAAHGKDDSWDGCMWYEGKRRPCQADVYVWLAEWNYIKGGWQSKNGRVTIAR